MNKRKAKAIQLGKATVVVLPIDWVRGHGIKQGDLLDVRYNGVVMIKPVKPERCEKGEGGR